MTLSRAEATHLVKEVARGLTIRYPAGVPDSAKARADYELGIIDKMGYSSYFLVVGDIVRHANEQGIRVGPGRGSAAGSMVSFALGITQLDPLEHGLIFERFLNPERPSFPDIDLDFDERRRGEVIRYVTEKYGEDHVAQIVTFSTIKTRAAIRDTAKVLFDKAGYALADRIIRALPPQVMAADIPLSGIFDPQHERYAEATEVRALVESDPQIAEIMEVANGLEGLKRQWGVHASGIVICAEPLIDHIPIMRRDSDGAIVTQLDMNACEALGLVKMDFLGLRNLTIMDDCLRDIAAVGEQPPDLANLPPNDPATFALLARGDTLGVFQLDGAEMRDLLRRMQPQCLADIAAAAALYRPGPMGAGSHINYVERKAGRQEITPIHSELAEPLADILGETYGLVVFQEEVLAIVQRVAGYSLGRADVLRRAMGKKKRDVLAREYEPFAAGMAANGYSPEATEALWNVFLPCADYLFVKSHATGYAVIAYQGAYLKAHYPAQYMAALLTSVGDKKDRMGIYLAECRRMGIKVTAPDINESEGPFTARDGEIRFGLAAVRDVGLVVVEAICQGRMHERYGSFYDCLRRVDATKLNSKALVALIRAGAFDSLGHPRRGLEDICVDALATAVKTQRAENSGLFSLFDDDESDEMDVTIPEHEWSAKKLLELEREMLGLYVSAHPLDGTEHILAAGTPIASILDGTVPVDTEVTVGGILASVTRKTSKAGKPWALAQLEDHAVGIELCCFARILEEFGSLLKRDVVVMVTGRVSNRDGERPSVIVDRVDLPDLSAPVTMALPLERCTRELVCELRKILERHPGDRGIRVCLLIGPGRMRQWEDEGGIRVRPAAALVSELTGLLGDGCLVG
jgi:DNA polymerase-3 subunit alpha